MENKRKKPSLTDFQVKIPLNKLSQVLEAAGPNHNALTMNKLLTMLNSPESPEVPEGNGPTNQTSNKILKKVVNVAPTQPPKKDTPKLEPKSLHNLEEKCEENKLQKKKLKKLKRKMHDAPKSPKEKNAEIIPANSFNSLEKYPEKCEFIKFIPFIVIGDLNIIKNLILGHLVFLLLLLISAIGFSSIPKMLSILLLYIRSVIVLVKISNSSGILLIVLLDILNACILEENSIQKVLEIIVIYSITYIFMNIIKHLYLKKIEKVDNNVINE